MSEPQTTTAEHGRKPGCVSPCASCPGPASGTCNGGAGAVIEYLEANWEPATPPRRPHQGPHQAIKETTGEHVRLALAHVNRIRTEDTGNSGFTDTEWTMLALYSANNRLLVATELLTRLAKAMLDSKLITFTDAQRQAMQERWEAGRDAIEFAEGRTS